MIAAILIVPLVYLINGFLIGRIIKKINININSFLATIIGLVFYFNIFYITGIWLYVTRVQILIYFIVFGIIQLFLVAFYIGNWRYIFLTWNINFKNLFNFVIVLGLTILICWLFMRDMKSEFGINWYSTIEVMPHDIYQPLILAGGEFNPIKNYSAFNVCNAFWVNAFSIKSINNSLTFCNWSWTIIASIFVAFLSTWLVTKQDSIPRVILSSFVVVNFVVLTLLFIESYAIGDAWMLLLLFVYILVMGKSDNPRSLKLFMLTTLLMGFLAASCTSFYLVICVWLFSMYYGIRFKQNSLNYVVILSWPLLLTIFSFISFFSHYLLFAVSSIYLLVVAILLIYYKRFGSPSWETKVALGIYHNSGKIVYVGLIVLIVLILVANFFIFQEVYKWNIKNINWKNFLTFTYSYIWTISINSETEIIIFNAVMYFVFVAITIGYLICRKWKKLGLKQVLKGDMVIKFGIIGCTLFINPLFIHILKMSTQSFPLNTLDLNMLFVVPIYVWFLKCFNYLRVSKITEWNYDWY